MNKLRYKRVVDSSKTNNNIYLRLFKAFLVGGCIALFGQLLYDLFLLLNVNETDSLSLMLVTIIFISALATGFGVFDKFASFAGAGSFIPISGFSNSLTSSALESKSEGLIKGIGSNMFKLAGSVITYGIVSAYILGIIKYFVSLIGGML